MADDRFRGVDPSTQTAIIAGLGFVLVIAGQSMSSRADPEYHPLVFGIGLVMLLYAVVRFAWERLAA